MLSFAHAFTGGAIAFCIDNPYAALPLALASHFVLDMLPHWNPDIPKEKKTSGKIRKSTVLIIIFDVVLALILGFSLAYLSYMRSPLSWSFLRVILGCFLAVLPDLVEAPLLLFNKKAKLSERLLEIQSKLQWNIPLPYGLITQIALVLLLYFLILF